MSKWKIFLSSLFFMGLVGLAAFFWRQQLALTNEPLNTNIRPAQVATSTVGVDAGDAVLGDVPLVRQPDDSSLVTSPLVVSGEAPGPWFFEGSFPLRLEDEQGNILATAIATASGDWMTAEFVPFLAQLDFKVASDTAATLVLVRDNPSGLVEYDAELRLPLTLKALEPDRLTLQVYFSNNQLDPEMTCEQVYAVERRVPRTEAVARAALEELLKGVSDSERAAGYQTNINAGVTLNSLAITDRIAYADFSGQLEEGVAGSCRVGAIRAQIGQTLRQFPSVDEVVISIDGRTADILQP